MNVRELRVITVACPWSAAIIQGLKPVENRSWHPERNNHQRGVTVPFDILIHSSRADHTRDLIHPIGRPARWRPNDPTKPSHVALAAAYADLDESSLQRGVILGKVTVAEVHPAGGACCWPWGEASYVDRSTGEVVKTVYHWLLEDIVPFDEPVEAKGRLGLWGLNDWLAWQVAEQLGEGWEA